MGTGRNCFKHQLIGVKCGQHDNPCIGNIFQNTFHRADTADPGHLQVHKDNIRTPLPSQLNGFGPIRRLGDNFYVGLD